MYDAVDVRAKYYKNALKKCVSAGLTAVHTNDENAWSVYTKLQEEEGLPVRVYLTPSIHELGKPMIPKAGDCNGLISCHRIKIFSDGSLGAVRKCRTDWNSNGRMTSGISNLSRKRQHCGFHIRVRATEGFS